MRRSSVPRRSRSRTIPGMRTCGACGQIYTRHAMVCPRCHGYGPLGQKVNHVVAAGAPVIINVAPPLEKPAPVYPEWVSLISDELRKRGHSTFRLNRVLERMTCEGATIAARDVVRAVLHYRFREPLPEVVDPEAEALARDWMAQ